MSTSKKHRDKGMPVLEILEEAIALLKSAFPALVLYYVATVPFVIGFLFFWAEASGGADAAERISPGALLLCLLFLVMKTGQARFASALHATLMPGMETRWNWRRWVSCCMIQGIWQPTGIIAIPTAALILLPFAHVFAFYQNLLLTGSGERTSQEAARSAWKLAGDWKKQSNLSLATLMLFSFVVFLNGWILLIMVPFLAKSLLGLDSVFTRSASAILNTTCLAAVCALVYLAVDPLFKAFYVLRCFYSESRTTGIDLEVNLKKLFAPPVAVLLLCFLMFPISARAQTVEPPAPKTTPASAELDRRIDEVLHRPEYRWRMPRDKEEVAEQKKGFLSAMLDDFFSGIRSVIKKTLTWLDKVWDKFQRFLNSLKPKESPKNKQESTNTDWMPVAQTTALVLLAAVACVVAVFLIRNIKKAKKVPISGSYSGPIRAPNLEDEELLASELPEDEWLKLGADMASRGERRLALRAYYLAIISHLASREYLSVAKHKTNRDYARELRRRARSHPELHGYYVEAMGIFERVWYGNHPVDDPAWNGFELKREEIFRTKPEETTTHA